MALTLHGTLDFHKNLIREKGIGSDILNKVVKNDFTKNKHKKDKDQALTSGTNEDKRVGTRVFQSSQFPN